MSAVTPVKVGSYEVGGGAPLLWICGPCVIESRDHTLRIAETLRGLAETLAPAAGLQGVVRQGQPHARGSRSAASGWTRGSQILDAVRRATGLPVTTDIHEAHQAAPAAEVCDVLQVPAFLARQTDLLEACGRTGPGGEREEGAVHGPVGHEERRRQAGRGRATAACC